MQQGQRSLLRACLIAILIAMTCGIGCQPRPVRSSATRLDGNDAAAAVSSDAASGASASAKSADPNEVTKSDPCASRMHEIAGVMLMYYALNRELPEHLDDLKTLADADQRLDFTCPQTQMRYVYTRAGLRAEGRNKIIILSDPVASHGGTRWCILMPDPATTPQRALEVLQLPESIFRLYHEPPAWIPTP